jgi:hypothetical protein
MVIRVKYYFMSVRSRTQIGVTAGESLVTGSSNHHHKKPQTNHKLQVHAPSSHGKKGSCGSWVGVCMYDTEADVGALRISHHAEGFDVFPLACTNVCTQATTLLEL